MAHMKRDPINDWSKTISTTIRMSKQAPIKRQKAFKYSVHKGLSDKQLRESVEQEQLIGYWIRDKGMKHADFVGHPYIDDVIMLINIRDSVWNMLNKSEQAVWGAYWNQVYHKRHKLKNKALIKFEKIISQALARHKIQALRQNP